MKKKAQRRQAAQKPRRQAAEKPARASAESPRAVLAHVERLVRDRQARFDRLRQKLARAGDKDRDKLVPQLRAASWDLSAAMQLEARIEAILEGIEVQLRDVEAAARMSIALAFADYAKNRGVAAKREERGRRR